MRHPCEEIHPTFRAELPECEPLTRREVYWMALSVSEGPLSERQAWARRMAHIVKCESTFDPEAVGMAGERGLAQIHPVHAPWLERIGYELNDLYDPEINLHVAWLLWLRQGYDAWSCAGA